MANRLPTPGGDDGQWGQILNDFLDVEHNADGTLKIRSDGTLTGLYTKPGTGIPESDLATAVQTKIDAGASAYQKPVGGIPSTDLSSAVQTSLSNVGNATKIQGTNVDGSAPADGQVLVYSQTSGTWVPNTATSTVVSDATTSTKGIVQLAGNLGGTASSPTVVSTSLASALPVNQGGTGSTTQNFVDLTTPQTVAGVKTFSSSPVVPTPTTGTQAASKGYVDTAVSGVSGGAQIAGDLGGTTSTPTVISTHLASALPIAQGGTGNTSGKALVDVASGGTTVGTRSKINFIQGTNVTLTTTDNSANGRVDVTIAAAGGGGGGGYTFNFVSKTANYTAVNLDYVFADSTSAGLTVTLPTPVASGFVRVKRMNPAGNGIQVAAPAGAFIDAVGVGTDTINSQYQSQDYLSDGTNWYRV